MAEIVRLDLRKRCQWCEGQVPRISINSQGYAIVTTDTRAQGRKLRRDGWREAWVSQYKDHRETTFISPTPAWREGKVLEEYLTNPICAEVRHRDLMNGF